MLEYCRSASIHAILAVAFAISFSAAAQNQVHIDHHFTNTDAQSLIGLPMGSHKTIVNKHGDLKWSQWSLKRKPLDTPIGFSSQMDGELAIDPYIASGASFQPLVMQSQSLYHGRYPFIVTQMTAGGVQLEELAFAADPDARPGEIPQARSGVRGVDVVRATFTNNHAQPASIILKLSGRERNLPGHVHNTSLVTNSGEDVALLSPAARTTTHAEDDGLTLAVSFTLEAHASKTLWLKLPYEWPAAHNAEVTKLPGDTLLQKAIAQWDGIWAQGTQISLPQQELDDFYYASIAYVLILTEYDKQGDLWALDGPAVYRQYWGRGEYFQARAMEVAGQMEAARRSVEHAFHIQNDDGEWDGPPTSGWPAWDNTGGNMAAAWDYYLYTRDKQWLGRAYPHMLAASQWVRNHREETELEDVDTVPIGARSIRRMIASRCRPEPHPPLKPGEKTYWYGLLPWSYGDSGLPEGHSYSHNFLAAYGVEVTADAARELDHPDDAHWLSTEFTAYDKAIRDSIQRSVALEKITPPYLPAMPTYPQGAYSQTFLAVYPTHLYSPNDPLVNGLLMRMEHKEKQGLPTNVAWAGPAGVWAGESMNMAETYLLRGEIQKLKDMFIAALNHSYFTKVWKEEMLVDISRPRACNTPHSKRANQEGTGDMPEAWANANYVDLLRDMLLLERDGKLDLLTGLPAEWIIPGQQILVNNAPTTLGGRVSFVLKFSDAHHMQLNLETSRAMDVSLRIPVNDGSTITAVHINGKAMATNPVVQFTNVHSSQVVVGLQ